MNQWNRAYGEPTPKPTDALEMLRELYADYSQPTVGIAIAAWEKERAELGRIEEKKAAALRKLAKKCEDVGAQYDHGDPDGDQWEAWGKLIRDLLRESGT